MQTAMHYFPHTPKHLPRSAPQRHRLHSWLSTLWSQWDTLLGSSCRGTHTQQWTTDGNFMQGLPSSFTAISDRFLCDAGPRREGRHITQEHFRPRVSAQAKKATCKQVYFVCALIITICNDFVERCWELAWDVLMLFIKLSSDVLCISIGVRK